MSKVLALCGYPRTGKDTIAEHLVSEHGWVRVAFADPLRMALYGLNPIVTYNGVNRRLADEVDENGWNWVKENCPEVRGLLQRLGTEAGRNVHGKNCWLEIAQKLIQRAHVQGKKVVLTDMRFPNEVAFLRKYQCFKMHVAKDGCGPVNNHASELMDYESIANCTILNNGSVEDLQQIVEHVITVDFGWTL
jgi:hypothetical protein